jgi:multidrug resistance efflux pump
MNGMDHSLTPSDPSSGSDLFPTKLPPRVTTALAGILIVVFAAAAGVAVLLPIPDAIRCRFTLMPEGGADPVRAPREGDLVQILVKETQSVRAGQDLFVIRSQQNRAWTGELRGLEQELAANAGRVALQEAGQKSALEIQTTRIQQFEKDLAFQQQYLATLRDFLSRYERLDAEGLVPRVDLKEQQLAAARGERDVAMTRQARDMGVLELERIRNDGRKELSNLALDRQKTETRIGALRKLLEGSREDLIRVAAPFDGTVLSVQQKNPGDVVTYGQELCRIARSDSPLIVHLAAPESGLTRLRIGQRVQLFYEAFPYERFGTGRGTLRWISPATGAGEAGRFTVHATLDAQSFNTAALRAGMSGDARVLVGSRTLVEYVFEPLRKLKETVGARP